MKSDFVRHGFAVFAAATVANVMSYLFRFLAARYVSVAEYGELSALLAFVNLFLAPALILGIAVTRYSSVFHALHDVQRLKSLKRLVFGFGAACSLTLLFAGALGRPVIASYLRVQDGLAIDGATAVIAVYFILPSLWALLQGTQKFYVYALVTALDGVLKVSFGLMAIFAGSQLGVVLFAYAAGGLISLAVVVLLLIRDDKGIIATPIKFDFVRLGQTIGGSAASTIAIATLSSIDLVFVQHFFRPPSVGLYAAANICGRALLFVVGFLPTIVLPKTAHLASKGESPLPILFYALGVAASVSGAILCIYFIVPALVITFFASAKYVGGSIYVFRYGIAMCLLACMNVIASYRMGIHSFGYVIPLCVMALGELLTMQFWMHGSLDQIVDTMVVGNAVALVLMVSDTLVRTRPRKRSPDSRNEVRGAG